MSNKSTYEPGTSTLEELWNKGKLTPESYPQLIRTLQRERNGYRRSIRIALADVAKARNHVREVVEAIRAERMLIGKSKH